jgi:hypothetical protein
MRTFPFAGCKRLEIRARLKGNSPLSATASNDAVGSAAAVHYADVEPNLDAMVEVLNNAGTVIASADPSDSFKASLSLTGLAAGTYYVKVSSHGSYEDVGRYSVTGSASSTIARGSSVFVRPDGETDIVAQGPNNSLMYGY